jgi:hypothetical protein
MMTKIAAMSVALALAACGGGGSSSTSSSAAPNSPAASPASAAQVFTLQGGGMLTVNGDGTAVFQQNGPAATLSPQLVGSPSLSPAPGAMNTSGESFGWDGATRSWQQNGAATPSFVLDRMGPAVGLSVSDFGGWAQIDSSTGKLTNVGFFAGGVSAGTTVPQSGSASYNGTYIANLLVHTTSTPISGGIRLDANFGQSMISSTFTSGALADHPMATGFINGPTYGASGGTDLLKYNVTGQFYGAGAAETTGTINGLAGAGAFNGVFGAKR